MLGVIFVKAEDWYVVVVTAIGAFFMIIGLSEGRLDMIAYAVGDFFLAWVVWNLTKK